MRREREIAERQKILGLDRVTYNDVSRGGNSNLETLSMYECRALCALVCLYLRVYTEMDSRNGSAASSAKGGRERIHNNGQRHATNKQIPVGTSFPLFSYLESFPRPRCVRKAPRPTWP